MDPSTPPAQDVQVQPTAQPINRAQPPQASLDKNGSPTASSTNGASQQVNSAINNSQTTPIQQVPSVQKPTIPKTAVSVGNIEAGGAATIVQEAPDADAGEDDEDEIKVAPQETKTQAVSQGGVANLPEEEIEMQPAVPEVPSASVEVEKFVEKSPDLEKPDIPKVVSDAGVTHAGPGVIVVPQNNFGVKKMPQITYQQAVTQVKTTRLHDSKHWFMAMMAYIWRKLNPLVDKEEKDDQNKTNDTTISLQKTSSQEENKKV